MNSVIELLESLAAKGGGSISFERLMEAALYDPKFGYYTANISTVGRGGDFSTSATLSDELGRAIAHWIDERSDSRDVSVIELGAGDGSLAEAILNQVGFWSRRRRWRYQMIDISPKLRQLQKERLKQFGKIVSWRGSIEEALDVFQGRALIFSNELVDAFPVRAEAETEAGWEEVRFRFDRKSGLQPITESNLGKQRLVHDSYRRWLHSWTPKLKEGSMLTIDYTGNSNQVRAYYQQQRVDAIFSRFGKQDLTADVNFDDLERWGEAIGWETVERMTQAEWITKRIGAGGRLTDANDAGGAFEVLEQRMWRGL
ncbi:MAG: SAM-dependent methyltransferase [Verrucomicrobiota bacterium]